MMKFARTSFVLALILPAAACNTTVYDMEALQRTTPQGTEFTKQMAADYLSLAQSEARQFDWIDSNYFAKKGRRAAAGEVVLPEDPDAWSNMPAGTQPALRDARVRLIAALDGGARDRVPQLAARAQSLRARCRRHHPFGQFPCRTGETCGCSRGGSCRHRRHL